MSRSEGVDEVTRRDTLPDMAYHEDDEELLDEEKRRPLKERVLHTRVPAVLERELKTLAESWRIPVSTVVRTILEEAVDTFDTARQAAGEELRDVANLVRGGKRSRAASKADASSKPDDGSDATPQAGAPLAGVIGFQPLLIAEPRDCALCGQTIERGAQAYLAVRDGAGPSVVVDPPCLPFAHQPKD